ncbi:GATOR complex protein MIOS [Eumeta japonica]|uniref:GATOR complex protein MIOS n=1 Tax=Eumeta variegata TaxID=151549 RepID=A0A4C1TQ15_EUMVA|nr:GATOR complex protein MIOS [Eumeta japonica]
MMSAAKLDAIWSPIHYNRFIVWGSDITLYEVSQLKDIERKSSYVKISNISGATVLTSQSAVGVRCADACCIPGQQDPLLALGHASGRVALVNLGQNPDPLSLAGRAFDNSSAPDQQRPLAEMGLSETAQNVNWTYSSARMLIASMNSKHIKIFDLRDLSNKGVSVATTKYCYGVCGDPFNEWQLASRGDNVLCVWDTRAFERPLLSLPQHKPLSKILWCPTRRNLICSLQRDATSLRLHDIQLIHNTQIAGQNPNESEVSNGPIVLERDVCPGSHVLSGFSWHPTHQARVLAVSPSGALLDYTVSERVTVSWGATAGLVWTDGALKTLPETFYANLHDISYTMKRRAQTEYGLKHDLWQNADLANDEQLSALWHFLALSKSLVEDGCIKNSTWRHPGVRWVLRADTAGGYRSEGVPSLLPDLPNRRITIYRSAERTRAMQLCNWGWGWENVGAGLERAEADGQWGRAAAVAAFHLRLRTALDILSRAPDPQMRMVALAVAGLSEERVWRETAATAAPSLPDPYLRALFAFLSAIVATASHHHQPDYDAVLNEKEMRLEDRVAFACIFLGDERLAEYVRRLTDDHVHRGALAGVLLTGSSPEGVSLLQRWLETTGDVQTAALVAARTFTPDLIKDSRVLTWIDSYRSLVDSWRLWWARCSFDTWLAGTPANHDARQVCIACGYCGKTVAAASGLTRPARHLPRLAPPAAKMKISACPHCRKPLPRCAVCALHMGTAGGGEFPGWFTWCVACRHGGHATHLLNWFREHTECPVSSCSCRCISMDPPPSAQP